MKRIRSIVIVGVFTVMMIGADFPGVVPPAEEKMVKRSCPGYVIIEAGKGIDCYGDTIRLMKKYGFYEVASRFENDANAQGPMN